MDGPQSFSALTIGEFVERLASPDPVPGGGSASAIAAALAASLVAMVASLSRNRPKYAAHAELHETAIPAAHGFAHEFLELADQDAAAYGACAAALKLPRATPAEESERRIQVSSTARVAAEIPLRCVERCVDVVALAEALAGRSNVNASSDLNVAALLTDAAARGAAANVLVNLPLIGKDAWTDAMPARIESLLARVAELAAGTRAAVASREARPALDALPLLTAAR